MFCRQCGTSVQDDSKFCVSCGTALPSQPQSKPDLNLQGRSIYAPPSVNCAPQPYAPPVSHAPQPYAPPVSHAPQPYAPPVSHAPHYAPPAYYAPQPYMPPPYAPPAYQKRSGGGLGVASMVLGIFGVILFFVFWASIILGTIALICGIVSCVKLKRQRLPRGTGIAGIVLGSIVIGIWALMGFLFLLVVFMVLL